MLLEFQILTNILGIYHSTVNTLQENNSYAFRMHEPPLLPAQLTACSVASRLQTTASFLRTQPNFLSTPEAWYQSACPCQTHR